MEVQDAELEMGKEEGKSADRMVRASGVRVRVVDEALEASREVEGDLEMECEARKKQCSIRFSRGGEVVYEAVIRQQTSVYQAAPRVLLLRVTEGSAVVTMATVKEAGEVLQLLGDHLEQGLGMQGHSVFTLRTEEASAQQYFQFYGYLSQQQNMMQDYVRTSTYQTAVLHNTVDFKDKVVLDVGAGTGVLSFFTLQAGARKVYAVEASNMAAHCQRLVNSNGYSDRMTVLAEKMEEVQLPEQVDIIISEPMGYMLFNERMLESYLHAKKWLKPGGKMYPTQGILYVAPFTDEALYMEQIGKTYFWHQHSFHGVDVSSLKEESLDEYFRQPIVDTFDIRILISRPIGHMTDFSTAQEHDLHKIHVPLSFTSWSTAYVHGLAFWFDVAFIGSQTTVWLSTAPFQPLTHWYQVRLLLKKPLFVQEGQEVGGWILMEANERQSYNISLSLTIAGSGQTASGSYDLKNPNFRYMSSAQAPPGTLSSNPTEGYFDGQSSSSLPQQPALQTLSLAPNPNPSRSYLSQPARAATEVIPVVNGSILSPAVQQQTSHRSHLAQDRPQGSLSPYSTQQNRQQLPQRTQAFGQHSTPAVPNYWAGQNSGYYDTGSSSLLTPHSSLPTPPTAYQYVLGNPPNQSGSILYQKLPTQSSGGMLRNNLANRA